MGSCFQLSFFSGSSCFCWLCPSCCLPLGVPMPKATDMFQLNPTATTATLCLGYEPRYGYNGYVASYGYGPRTRYEYNGYPVSYGYEPRYSYNGYAASYGYEPRNR